ncbi:MAG TPA: wax ester/triacylglycerol synthase family O-acyltransferase [Labilithrix sp.]|nr:wax ester/triacylglycerol synthase family O-acyltransferase [Labilithrix sp.]
MSTRKTLNALDRSFLASERRDVMMHVGALLQFSPPKAGAGDFGRQLREELARDTVVERPWNLRLLHPDLLASPLQAWVEDEHFDLEYHVRRSALASPGDQRELGMLVSRLHGTPLDFHRPPWEAHFIEGLENGRFAIYFKVHHALIDGYTGMRMLMRSMSSSPDDLETPMFFACPEVAAPRPVREDEATFDMLLRAVREQLGATKDVGRALVNVVKALRQHDKQLVAPLQAPKSVLNQKITRSRRFATQQVSIATVKRIATAAGGTVNDVVLAICGASLRRFLEEQDALPERSLIAMLPVNIRPKDDPGGSGNAVGSILATLGTDIRDPKKRLAAIVASTRRAKEQLQGMSKNAILQYSAIAMTPMMLSFIPGAAGRFRPAFNVVVSNVPGPETPLYFRGWKLDEMYPLSIPFHGYGLNITVQSYAGSLGFGFIGCRDTLPHLQRLAVYSRDVLEELEWAFPKG